MGELADTKEGRAAAANDRFEQEFTAMADRGFYRNPEKFFGWVKDTCAVLLDIDPEYSGGGLALSIGDRIDKDPNLDPENTFKGIIEYGERMGLKCELHTTSPRYKASVVLANHLEKLGLLKPRMKRGVSTN